MGLDPLFVSSLNWKVEVVLVPSRAVWVAKSGFHWQHIAEIFATSMRRLAQLEFDSEFELIKTIQSERININEKRWIIYDANITQNNITNNVEQIVLETNFDQDKINKLFSNISTLNLLELFSLKEDYEKLGYSSDEILIHLLKLFSMPLFYGVLTILSAIIMFNVRAKSSILFHIILGILMSVLIYYMNFVFNSLGNNGKIPIFMSIFFPILFISLISIIGLVRINEK